MDLMILFVFCSSDVLQCTENSYIVYVYNKNYQYLPT